MSDASKADVDFCLFQGQPSGTVPCYFCHAASSGRHSIPTYNGDIVSKEFPLDTANHPACERCYKLHESGLIVAYDHRYKYLFGTLEGGEGI